MMLCCVRENCRMSGCSGRKQREGGPTHTSSSRGSERTRRCCAAARLGRASRTVGTASARPRAPQPATRYTLADSRLPPSQPSSPRAAWPPQQAHLPALMPPLELQRLLARPPALAPKLRRPLLKPHPTSHLPPPSSPRRSRCSHSSPPYSATTLPRCQSPTDWHMCSLHCWHPSLLCPRKRHQGS